MAVESSALIDCLNFFLSFYGRKSTIIRLTKQRESYISLVFNGLLSFIKE